MGNTTPNKNLPYPVTTDFARVPADVRNLASTLDASLVSMDQTDSELDDRITALETSIGTRQTYTPRWYQSNGATLGIGNGSITGWYSTIGPLAFVGMSMTRGSTTNVGAAGNYYLWSLPDGLNSSSFIMTWGAGIAAYRAATIDVIGAGAIVLVNDVGRIGMDNPGGWVVGHPIRFMATYWRV